MKKKNDLILVNKKYLENKIYIIRGQKIMLDKDLAEIYGYSTSLFNRQVNRNKEKFDNDFMFKLTEQEAKSLRCQNGISKNKGRGGNRYASYAFTEKGIYMLMTILKGPLAIKQSIALIRLFDSLKKYIIENRELLTNNEIELRTSLLERDVKDINNHLDVVDNSLNKVMGYFEDKESYKHFLILNGKKLEADITYKNIFKLAKSSIIYIDNYIGLKTLELLSCSNKKVSITIFSDNKSKPSLTKSMIDDFNIQNNTNNLSLYKPSIKIHDRYIIIDHNTKNEAIYHCGASIKDSGNKISTITKLEMPILYKTIIDDLLKNVKT